MALPYMFFIFFPDVVGKLPKPGKWMLKVKYFMGGLLILTALWVIWILSNQLGTAAAIIIMILATLKLIKLYLVNHISFLSKRSVKYTVILSLIFLIFILPLKVAKYSQLDERLEDGIWQDFNESEISQIVTGGNVVFVDVTADWCITCKVNKFLVLDDEDIISALSQGDVVAMRADWTSKNADIASYLKKHGRFGVPFNIIYGPNFPGGKVLPELLTKANLLETLDNSRK